MGAVAKHHYRFSFLKSEFWQNFRLERITRCKGRCNVCANEFPPSELDVHHLFYRGNPFDTQWHDTRVLCRPCHDLVHANTTPGKYKTLERAVMAYKKFIKPFRRKGGNNGKPQKFDYIPPKSPDAEAKRIKRLRKEKSIERSIERKKLGECESSKKRRAEKAQHQKAIGEAVQEMVANLGWRHVKSGPIVLDHHGVRIVSFPIIFKQNSNLRAQLEAFFGKSGPELIGTVVPSAFFDRHGVN